MNILITGGCGFIGSHIAEFHLKKGNYVRIVDDLSTGALKNITYFKDNPLFQFFNADILHWSGLKKAVKWADQIYHFAAVIGVYRVLAEPINVFSTNILGCERLLKEILKSQSRPRVIIASSSSVYGHSKNTVLNENDDLILKTVKNPLSGYAVSKISSEELGLAYYRMADIPITPVRLFNVIGPRQSSRYGMVVPRLIKQACDDQPLTIYGDGTQTRSFCDIRDIVESLEMIASQNKSYGEIINIGNDSEIAINDLALLIRKKTNSHSDIHHIPYLNAYGTDFTDIMLRKPDLKKFNDLIGYKNQWSLEKSIEYLISFHRSEEVCEEE